MAAAETQTLLPAGVIVQKTITLQLGPLLLQVTGVGDFALGRRSIRAIAAAFGLSRRQASYHSINPAHCDPQKEYGLQAGMVSPFLPPNYPTRLAAVVQIPWPVEWEREQREVAIALSLCESLMLPLSSFLDVLREYAKHAYPDQVSFIVLPEACDRGGSASFRVKEGRDVGARFNATLSGGQVIGEGPVLDYGDGEIERHKHYA
jgi:hypothetical protein